VALIKHVDPWAEIISDSFSYIFLYPAPYGI